MGFDKGADKSNFEAISLGRFGHNILTSSSDTTDPEVYYAGFQVISAAVVSYKSTPEEGDKRGNSNDNYGGDASQTDLSLPAGFAVFGRLSEIDVTSGSIIAYLG